MMAAWARASLPYAQGTRTRRERLRRYCRFGRPQESGPERETSAKPGPGGRFGGREQRKSRRSVAYCSPGARMTEILVVRAERRSLAALIGAALTLGR